MTILRSSLQSHLVAAVMAAAVFLMPTARAADGDPVTKLATAAAALQKVKVKADDLDFDRKAQVVTASGNVVVTKGDAELRADKVVVDMATEIAVATGNVNLTSGETNLQGQELTYNFATGEAVYDEVSSFLDPFYIRAGQSHRVSANHYILKDAELTTCEDQIRPPYRVKAKHVDIVPGKKMKARHAVVYLSNIPVLYTPIYHKNLNDEVGLSLTPGYSSRMGAFMLAAYGLKMGESVLATSHLDLRSRRGLGVGQDFEWSSPDGSSHGDISLYYASDDNPNEDDEDPAVELVDSERHRLSLNYYSHLGPRTTFQTRLQLLSDPDVLEDFFDSEYRYQPQPDNFVSLTHREDDYSAGLIVRRRLNDFYNTIDRAPEGFVRFPRQQVGDSRFYYEGETSLARLERQFAETSGRESYDTVRGDSLHRLLYPRKYDGFLRVTPRIGVRGTYYGDTLGQESVTTSTVETDENGDPVLDDNGNTVTQEVTSVSSVAAGSDMRTMIEFGVESSFKAFKIWDAAVGEPGDGLRHIVEPYVNYTFLPDPSTKPSELFQFDSIDAIDEQHSLLLGVRNKWQTKRNGVVREVLDLNTFTTYLIEDYGGASLSDVFFDGEIRFWPGSPIDFDAVYDLDTSTLEQFNSEIRLHSGGHSTVDVHYRFTDQNKNVVAVDFDYLPNERWGFNLNGRYEFDESQTEEIGLAVRRNIDCLGVILGVSHIPSYTRTDGQERESESRLWAQVWLTAFPHQEPRLGR